MKQLESFFGLTKVYGQMIPNYATKMLSLEQFLKDNFRLEKEEQNAFENIKLSYVLTHLFSLIVWRKKQPWQKISLRKQ